MSRRELFALVPVVVASFVAGLLVGRFVLQTPDQLSSATPRRLSGYTYINPLLTYDIDQKGDNPKFATLRHDLQNYIKQQKVDHHIDEASVYFRQLSTGEDLSVNPEVTFEPGSLSKVPLLLALYKRAEKDPSFLQQTITLPDQDANQHLEVLPGDPLKPGETYTVDEAIYKLITASDNNPYKPLFESIDFADFQKSFSDLYLPFQSGSQGFDFFTTKDFSYFIRVLYNATYLTKEYSEKAMELLAKAEYQGGIAAGVPNDTVVSHKFGIISRYDTGWTLVQSRQLHDCGLVYAPDRPYILCVMTRGSATLAESENVIQTISKKVYEAEMKGFQ